jgi:ribosome-associated translation inhibitor RaiA
MTPVEVHAAAPVPRSQLESARRRLEQLQRSTDDPIEHLRLTLRRGPERSKRPYVADASAVVKGRVLAAHVSGPTAEEAAEAVAERLRRQLRRIAGAEVARRDEPDEIRRALAAVAPDVRHRPEKRLKAPEDRRLVRRRTYASTPIPALTAVADLLDMDLEFNLFVHARTNEDVVVYRRSDGGIGLIHPPGSPLADEDGIVVPEPSRYAPMTLAAAKAQLDDLDLRWIFFVDVEDGRGKVLYLRHDGDYGLVEPVDEDGRSP